MAWSIAEYLGELVCTKISHGSLLCLEMTLWTQNDVSKCDVLKPNGFPAAWNFEQHLSQWLRENDVPKPPNLWARTAYRVNGSCVEDLTSHTESFRTNLCNHSPGAGTWRVPFEFAPLVSLNLISPVYYPKLTIQNLALIDLILCMSMLHRAFVFYNDFPVFKGPRISKNTSKNVFENGKKPNLSC